MMLFTKRLFVPSFILILAAVVQGCVSTADTTQQEQDRQSAVAAKLKSEYLQMKGQFAGTYNFSNVVLSLDVLPEPTSATGGLAASPGLVSAPQLVGSVTVSPEVFVNSTGEPMEFPYPVTSGQYTGSSTEGDLALVVQEGGNGANTSTNLYCKVLDLDHLNCEWYVEASISQHASFSLERTGSAQALSDGSGKHLGTYSGANADAEFQASFNTFLKPQTGSNAVPVVSIVGNFIISRTGANAGVTNQYFTDGEYDPISSTIAVSIPSANNSVLVNCKIRSGTSMHCTWIGTHGVDAHEEFDLAKTDEKP